jgi:hypothetical protein
MKYSDTANIIRQVMVYSHVLLFALAVVTILQEDVKLAFSKTVFDVPGLHETANIAKWSLFGLWITGIVLTCFAVDGDWNTFLNNDRLVVKVIVVIALTLNGVLLHYWIFPLVATKGKNAAVYGSIFGAISTVSWVYASVLGSTRYVNIYFDFETYVAIYILGLVIAVLIATVFVRPIVTASIKKIIVNFKFGNHVESEAVGNREAFKGRITFVGKDCQGETRYHVLDKRGTYWHRRNEHLTSDGDQ